MEAVGERMTPAVQMPNPAAGPREVSRPVQTGEKKPVPKPAGDRYAPEAPREPIGIYRAEKDGEGRTSIRFDAPRKEKEAAREKKPETTTCDTGRVDREVEQLKKKQAELKKRLETEPDEKKRRELEQQLSQVEGELIQKDNDAYRRQNASYA